VPSDFDPRPVIQTHWRSVEGARAAYAGTSVAAFAVAWLVDAEISSETAAACITVAGLISAFFLQLAIQINDRAAAWAAEREPPSEDRSDLADLTNDLAANAVYGTLVSFACALVGVSTAVTDRGLPERLGLGLLVALLVHVGLTLILVGVRTFHSTVTSTDRARTDRERSGR